MHSEVITIDAKLAEELMETNFELNRRVNPVRLAQLIADMKAGRFIANGDTIRIDVNGQLIDGQHRLLAIMATGIAIECVVVRGIAVEAVLTIDTGQARTSAQLVKMSGSTASRVTAMAAVARAVIMYQGDKAAPSKTEIARFSIKHEDALSHAVHLAAPVTKSFHGGIGLYGCAAHVLTDIDVEWTIEFFQSLSDGVDLKAGDPILALRNHLIKKRGAQSTKWALLDGLHPIFKAWNIWRAGKTTRSISVSRNSFPEPR